MIQHILAGAAVYVAILVLLRIMGRGKPRGSWPRGHGHESYWQSSRRMGK